MKYIGGSRAFNFDDEELLSGKGNGLATRIPAEDSEDDDSSIVHCFMKPAVHSHPRGAGDPPDWRILSDAASYFLQVFLQRVCFVARAEQASFVLCVLRKSSLVCSAPGKVLLR
ncbi:hypothetical protein Y032_0008g353 [Ancylostoma ceylanicum]|uniref:Uncharacterized protein n=1 Tax=Ancylostoma ceylanicum TaxID=53326 RepID=A0A016VM92_9BILA|nr:hypothetical protein Y032_0008g353 [Ancylostoma ceylanicum]